MLITHLFHKYMMHIHRKMGQEKSEFPWKTCTNFGVNFLGVFFPLNPGSDFGTR